MRFGGSLDLIDVFVDVFVVICCFFLELQSMYIMYLCQLGLGMTIIHSQLMLIKFVDPPEKWYINTIILIKRRKAHIVYRSRERQFKSSQVKSNQSPSDSQLPKCTRPFIVPSPSGQKRLYRHCFRCPATKQTPLHFNRVDCVRVVPHGINNCRKLTTECPIIEGCTCHRSSAVFLSLLSPLTLLSYI